MKKQISDLKASMILASKNKSYEVGETVYVKKEIFGYTNNPNREIEAKIVKINGDKITINGDHNSEKEIDKSQISNRLSKWYAGINPFAKDDDSVRMVLFGLESIIGKLNLLNEDADEGLRKPVFMNGIEVKRANWNPFVIDKDGKKEYYQRDFCWSLEDNQLLLESIYNNIDCGKVIIRNRSWNWLENQANAGETELGFCDIVDGKQRLNAIRGFLLNEYPDMKGYYWNDLSDNAQNVFLGKQMFSYGEMSEDSTDKQVIAQFLKMNFTGVPQSKEHIEYVKSISL